MSTSSSFSSTLTLASGAVLVFAVAAVWLTTVRSLIRVVAAQGVALGLVALILGVHEFDAGLIATAAVVLVIKGLVMPYLLGRATAGGALARESRPLVNVPAALVISAILIVLAFATTRGIGHFVGTTAGELVPLGVATLLIGFFTLMARRRPISQMVGLVLVDNGIALVAFLCTAGVPFLIEIGVSLDILLGVTVLIVLAQRLASELGDFDLDELQELHD